MYTSSLDRDEHPKPQDAFIYGSFWVFAEESNDMTMGIVLDCRDGKRYVLPFLKHDPVQVFKVSPSTCTPTGTVFTGGKKEDARVRPAPRLQTRALIFAPGKAYYLGDLTGSVVGYHAVHTFPMYTDRGSMTYGLESEAWGWKLETNKDKYQATTREFQAAYPNLAGVPTESQMIGQ